MFMAVLIHLCVRHINWPFICPFMSQLINSSDTGQPDQGRVEPLYACHPLEIYAATTQGTWPRLSNYHAQLFKKQKLCWVLMRTLISIYIKALHRGLYFLRVKY